MKSTFCRWGGCARWVRSVAGRTRDGGDTDRRSPGRAVRPECIERGLHVAATPRGVLASHRTALNALWTDGPAGRSLSVSPAVSGSPRNRPHPARTPPQRQKYLFSSSPLLRL